MLRYNAKCRIVGMKFFFFVLLPFYITFFFIKPYNQKLNDKKIVRFTPFCVKNRMQPNLERFSISKILK